MDPAHIIKLARNCFSEKTLRAPKGIIEWEFITKLNAIQNEQN